MGYIYITITNQNLGVSENEVIDQYIYIYISLSLVGGLEPCLFFHILGMSSPKLTNSYFSEG